jgi:hypothetical protein
MKPNKAKLKRKLHKEAWQKCRESILALHDNKCAICGKTDVPLDIHHCLGRKNELQYNLTYLLPLCKKDHKFLQYPNISAHKNSLFFAIFLEKNYNELWLKIKEEYNKCII